MKRILLVLLSLATMFSFSQNSKRQLLKNEIGTQRVRAKASVSAYQYGNNNIIYQPSTWGDSEVFLKISERGYFTVEIDRQIMSNPYGKFRFFEVGSGLNTLSIYKNGFLIYRSRISVPVNSRMILDLSHNRLYLLDIYRINNDYDVWADCNWGNNDWGNDTWDNNVDNIGYDARMTPQEFTLFKEQLKNTANFDKDKIELIDMQLSMGTGFNTLQIKQLIETFDFDKGKLKAAKILYLQCTDPNNYYMVLDEFDFDSSRRELKKFIRENPRQRRR